MQRYDDRGENFYYKQEDFLFELAAKRNWTWNIIRPHAIVGFTPAGNYGGPTPAMRSRTSANMCKLQQGMECLQR